MDFSGYIESPIIRSVDSLNALFHFATSQRIELLSSPNFLYSVSICEEFDITKVISYVNNKDELMKYVVTRLNRENVDIIYKRYKQIGKIEKIEDIMMICCWFKNPIFQSLCSKIDMLNDKRVIKQIVKTSCLYNLQLIFNKINKNIITDFELTNICTIAVERNSTKIAYYLMKKGIKPWINFLTYDSRETNLMKIYLYSRLWKTIHPHTDDRINMFLIMNRKLVNKPNHLLCLANKITRYWKCKLMFIFSRIKCQGVYISNIIPYECFEIILSMYIPFINIYKLSSKRNYLIE